ncbi:MAG TPA: ABC transporter permease [Dehalococcoidia bacterium]|nr:ABC transporter permease [Dehalococcoidia bacterium]
MSFAGLIARNVYTRKVRSILTGAAVAIGIMTVVALGVLTHSLNRTAVSVLRTGSADFTVAQKNVSDVLYSAMDEGDITRIQQTPGVASVVGVLVAAVQLDSAHPFFLELGIQPDALANFGVSVVAGRPYAANATGEVMLGYRAARDLNKSVGDNIVIDGNKFKIVGIFSTGQVFGDSASMLPLTNLQTLERKPGAVTLAFVKVTPGANIDAVRAKIEHDNAQLATVRTQAEFGRVDRNLRLISAANVGISILALAFGAIGVMNTTAMSVFERTREFGVMRAVGWTRARVIGLVMGEAALISLLGACIGIALGFAAIRLIQRVPELIGVFQPDYTASVFARALAIAMGMALIGALYPAIRAALLSPLEALRHE